MGSYGVGQKSVENIFVNLLLPPLTLLSAEEEGFEHYMFSTGCRHFVSLRHKVAGNLFKSALTLFQKS